MIISNHGGRQVDSAPSPISVLPEIVAAVGDDLEVLMDSGIRRGSDIAKALALGARACLIGRPYLYGLAADGQAGATKSIEILVDELRRTMALIGATSGADLTPRLVRPPIPPGV